MKNGFTISTILPASPEQVYKAWLSSAGHSAMTGSKAHVVARVGGSFTAWDGYITGTTTALEPFTRIVQDWRTSEFPEDAPDSKLEIRLRPVKNGTRLTLMHRNIPEGQADSYESGWDESYFQPMKAYFTR